MIFNRKGIFIRMQFVQDFTQAKFDTYLGFYNIWINGSTMCQTGPISLSFDILQNFSKISVSTETAVSQLILAYIGKTRYHVRKSIVINFLKQLLFIQFRTY
jgi:hypothetical protein